MTRYMDYRRHLDSRRYARINESAHANLAKKIVLPNGQQVHLHSYHPFTNSRGGYF